MKDSDHEKETKILNNLGKTFPRKKRKKENLLIRQLPHEQKKECILCVALFAVKPNQFKY